MTDFDWLFWFHWIYLIRSIRRLSFVVFSFSMWYKNNHKKAYKLMRKWVRGGSEKKRKEPIQSMTCWGIYYSLVVGDILWGFWLSFLYGRLPSIWIEIFFVFLELFLLKKITNDHSVWRFFFFVESIIEEKKNWFQFIEIYKLLRVPVWMKVSSLRTMIRLLICN